MNTNELLNAPFTTEPPYYWETPRLRQELEKELANGTNSYETALVVFEKARGLYLAWYRECTFAPNRLYGRISEEMQQTLKEARGRLAEILLQYEEQEQEVQFRRLCIWTRKLTYYLYRIIGIRALFLAENG